MDDRTRRAGANTFHAVRWQLESLFSPAVIMFVVSLAALLYVAVTGLFAGPRAPVAADPPNLILAVLFVLFLLGLAWTLYATTGRRKPRDGV